MAEEQSVDLRADDSSGCEMESSESSNSLFPIDSVTHFPLRAVGHQITVDEVNWLIQEDDQSCV